MSEFENYDLEEKIKELELENAAKQTLDFRKKAVNAAQAGRDGFLEAIKEFGISETDFNDECSKNHQLAAKAARKASRKMVETVLAKSGRKGPLPAAQRPHQKAGDYQKIVAAAKEKAAKTGAVSDDELLDILGAIL